MEFQNRTLKVRSQSQTQDKAAKECNDEEDEFTCSSPPLTGVGNTIGTPQISDNQISRFIDRHPYTPLILKTLLWLMLWLLFISLEFGAVYFVVSSLFVIYRTMRTKPRSPGELSAYSVFNPNCERLEGTFTAEQFEKELRYGAGSVH
ncbi:SAYSvFN domain-containing protein 1-like isoform X2 [Tubulanus polymorphus]|uniref:SAYSvFN domain-containing protein 1-like isoform X2 n=1 Tax=Tubulanus polymorphus TaxID=672921 RepID=UPI003DA5E00B